jgi:hypothetical protein
MGLGWDALIGSYSPDSVGKIKKIAGVGGALVGGPAGFLIGQGIAHLLKNNTISKKKKEITDLQQLNSKEV